MTKKEELAQLLANLNPTIDELPGDLPAVARIIERMVPGKGVQITLAIAAENRGTYILFHNTDALERGVRDRWIVEQYENGVTAPEIARAAELGVRRVWDILGTEPVDDRQMKLF
ncbi:hypothetical protein JYT85_01415 [Desulfocapsa sp. AH-315-G09]|uniref:Mor transcription activator domain-containing protein n=1 Tax=Desulfotalea psychrophila TaxID=84980 RepID=A0ABS3AWE1_9BACT|nr:hypothetical protein [Desulfocapsa sp.]MBN4065286.1 hypothetical protein [Desulfocapsa sp. AH-315-G09]MBN4068865.1 hypothetical protein [Desulfotalea psychrophila]